MSKFNFKKFILSKGIEGICDQFLMFSVPLAILKYTNSASLSALSFVITWIPRVIFFPIAGALLDGIDVKKIFILLNIFRILCLVVVLILIKNIGIFFPLIILMSLMSLCYVINFVSVESLIPNNIKKENFPKAHSWIQIIEQLSQVIGPTIAVLIYTTININGILIFSIFLFLISLLNILKISFNKQNKSKKWSFKSIYNSNIEAFKYLIDDKKIIYLCALTWVVNIIFGVVLSITPAIVLNLFKLKEFSLGLMQSIAAIMSIFIFYLLPYISKRIGITLVGKLSFVIILFSGFILSLSKEYYFYLFFYTLIIAFDGSFSVYIRTMRSNIIPKHMLSKVIGIVGMLNLLSIPLGGMLVTILSLRIKLLDIVLISSILSIFFALFVIAYGYYKLSYKKFFP